nr:hypothetical protein CFP56_67035 [Quercus suber]
MLAITTPHAYRPSAFQPAVPSPLSPRSVNIYGGSRRIISINRTEGDMDDKQSLPIFSSSPVTSNHASTTNANPSSPSPSPQSRTSNSLKNSTTTFSKRKIKQVPGLHHDELNERRRGIFLRKVKDGREEKRFDDVSAPTAMQNEQLRSAPTFSENELDEEEDEPHAPMASDGAMYTLPQEPAEELDEVLQHEDQELAALLEYMPGTTTVEQTSHEGDDVMNSWSDDDEYDDLFSGLMDDGRQQQQQQQDHLLTHLPDADGDEIMDMS